jgi:hypothetical protein
MSELGLEKYGLPKQTIPKLRGTLVTIEGDGVSEGPRLRRLRSWKGKPKRLTTSQSGKTIRKGRCFI